MQWVCSQGGQGDVADRGRLVVHSVFLELLGSGSLAELNNFLYATVFYHSGCHLLYQLSFKRFNPA